MSRIDLPARKVGPNKIAAVSSASCRRAAAQAATEGAAQERWENTRVGRGGVLMITPAVVIHHH